MSILRTLTTRQGRGGTLVRVIPGSTSKLSAHDRMILDVEKAHPSPADRRALCEQIDLPLERYRAVLDGIADTDPAYSYAPTVVLAVRRARAEKFAFERRSRRWRTLRPEGTA